ncbi:14830_t:CDS:2, partial [Racocetra persica]
PINLLFAASGDLNDIIMSVNGIPLDFNQPVNICVNDFAERVVVRNFIILYLFAKLGKNAIDIAIHIWYSSALTDEQMIGCYGIFNTVFQDLLGSNMSGSQITEEYEFKCKVKICTHFSPNTWMCLAEMLENSTDLQTGVMLRNKIMLDPARIDYRHRHMQALTPGERICFDNFRHHGILLPYGALNAHHNVQNKFILDPTYGWLLPDNSEPLSGWDISSVVQVKHGTADEDLYGKLYFYLREQFGIFIDRLENLTINFDLYDEDALELGKNLKSKRFDRIYVNNISDESYVDNNVMAKIFNILDEISNETNALYDHTQAFETYMETKGANKTAKEVGLRRRTVHRIVPKRVGVSMREDEQNNVLSLEDERDRHLLLDVGMNTFLERYVEWEVVA